MVTSKAISVGIMTLSNVNWIPSRTPIPLGANITSILTALARLPAPITKNMSEFLDQGKQLLQ